MNLMVRDYESAKQQTICDFERAVQKIKDCGNEWQLKKLEHELKRIDKLGGIDNFVPTEGITFFFAERFMKLTGLFAPINQIIGMARRM